MVKPFIHNLQVSELTQTIFGWTDGWDRMDGGGNENTPPTKIWPRGKKQHDYQTCTKHIFNTSHYNVYI